MVLDTKAFLSRLDRLERLNEHLNPRMTSALLYRANRSSVSTVIAIMAMKGHVSERGEAEEFVGGRERLFRLSYWSIKNDIFSVSRIEMPSGRTYLGIEGFRSFQPDLKMNQGPFFSSEGIKDLLHTSLIIHYL